MNLSEILDKAMEVDASDVHLICGNKPMLRIARDLVPIKECEILWRDVVNRGEVFSFFKEKPYICAS